MEAFAWMAASGSSCDIPVEPRWTTTVHNTGILVAIGYQLKRLVSAVERILYPTPGTPRLHCRVFCDPSYSYWDHPFKEQRPHGSP
jgi:hypothetical protein